MIKVAGRTVEAECSPGYVSLFPFPQKQHPQSWHASSSCRIQNYKTVLSVILLCPESLATVDGSHELLIGKGGAVSAQAAARPLHGSLPSSWATVLLPSELRND